MFAKFNNFNNLSLDLSWHTGCGSKNTQMFLPSPLLREPMSTFFQDLKYGVRGLANRPGFMRSYGSVR